MLFQESKKMKAASRSLCESAKRMATDAYDREERGHKIVTRIMMKLKVNPKRVLIYEDNPGDAYLMKMPLTESGWSVTIVDNANECVTQIKNDGFGMLILDLGFPPEDGWGVLGTLQQEIPKDRRMIKIILTNRQLTDDKIAALKEMEAYYLNKSRLGQLIELIQQISEEEEI